jgi:SAM-dependent methyltransferase
MRPAEAARPSREGPEVPGPPPAWKQSKGIFISPVPRGAGPDYPDDLRDWVASIEPEHFWFRSRARLIAATVRSRVSPGGWLELGCGTGYVLAEVARRYPGPCLGQDVSWRALEITRTRTAAPLYWCALDEVPARALAGVGLFDVLEHVPDDVAALKAAAGYLREGGIVLVTVPAHPWLWSQVDEASRHERRYTRRGLVGIMDSAGLRVEFCRPFYASLLPGLLLRRTIRLRGPHDARRMFLRPPPKLVNGALEVITALEGGLCRMGLTFLGTSWLALGRKV